MPKKSQKAEKKTKKAEGAFRTISEVADLLDVQQHVLRFWETKFSQVKPLKRGGGRRYYRPEDVALLQRIHHLLYTEGYTIKGAQKLLKGQSKSQIVAGAQAQKEAENQNQSPAVKFEDAPQAEGSQVAKKGLSQGQKTALEAVLEELKALREAVD
ncbi:MAG: MerR family transcriptional regulator [Alphaproteobacteria bacterium]|nr:MerR family transcriptional regulator [Alphaproteobacteria bacterium]